MDNLEKYVPLIRLTQGSRNIPWGNIDDHIVTAFRDVAQRLDPQRITECEMLLRLLECFLQVTGRHLSISSIQKPAFKQLSIEFVGALYSEKFWSVRILRRGHCVRYFLRYVAALRIQYPNIPTTNIRPAYRSPLPPPLACCVEIFEKLKWIEEKAYIWHGWPAETGGGRYTCIQLYPIYARLGRDFTDQLHEAYRLYIGGRRAAAPIAANELSLFISSYDGDLTPAHFRSSEFMTDFWRRFALFYVSEALRGDKNVVNAISGWRRRFVFFAKNYLEASGLVARTHGDFPCPPKRHPDPAHCRIKKDTEGIEVKTKLLTPVPLHVTDSQALTILFHQIERDLNTIVQWAQSEISELWARYINRIELAKDGTSRRISLEDSSHLPESEDWLVALDNPSHLANACATFEKYGYLHISDLSALHRVYPLGTREMAHLFALPTTAALLPHCTLLAALHPKITSIFLESLELYSPSGHMIGFVETNGTKYIVGTKSRKVSPAEKEQRIELNAESSQIVEQIITLTAPLRTYLKRKEQPAWRHLLLSCGDGFGRPCKASPLSSYTNRAVTRTKTVHSIMRWTNVSAKYAEELAEHFSLPAVRSSAALLVYLKTWDMGQMSEALGHRKLNLQLLDHYLPRSIRDFFQERWVRIFQQSLVVDALKDSEHILAATRFASMEELNEFLSIHALNRIPNHYAQPSKEEKKDVDFAEVIISINTGILTALVSLKGAVDSASSPPTFLARYWAQFAGRLTAFIDSSACHRPDFKLFLSRARSAADPSAFENLIHE